MPKSYAEHMADEMGHEDGGGEEHDGEELGAEDSDKAGITEMEELIKHLRGGDAEAAWECFKRAQDLADNDDGEEEGEGEMPDDLPLPEGGSDKGGHAALLLMPRGGH
jgi:hypothetical protein